MKPDPPRPAPADWPIEHPWLYIYTVITTMLLGFLAAVYFADWLKGVLP